MKPKISLLTMELSKVPMELLAWTQTLSVIEHNTDLTTVQIIDKLSRHIRYIKKSSRNCYDDSSKVEVEMWETVINHIKTFVKDTPITKVIANTLSTNECSN